MRKAGSLQRSLDQAADITLAGAPFTRRSLELELERSLGSRSEARWIVEEVLGPRGTGNTPSKPSVLQVSKVKRLTARRLSGEPLQYVLGHWQFRNLDLLVDSRALIPRPETEEVVDAALRELRSLVAPTAEPIAVDLGTGSGAIALSLAMETMASSPSLRVLGTDVDASALALAELNRDRLSTKRPDLVDRVRFLTGNWWGALSGVPGDLRGKVVLVVSNPPYVAPEEWVNLDATVKDYEPRQALVASPGDGGAPGMADVEKVLSGAREWLARPGSAVIEIAHNQGAAAARVAKDLGAQDVLVEKDLAGRDRILTARWT